jgi:hypothetical protein
MGRTIVVRRAGLTPTEVPPWPDFKELLDDVDERRRETKG